MNIVEEGQLEGDFNGFEDNKTIFQFFGGNKWQQNECKYVYRYMFMPKARIIEEIGLYFLEVEDINDRVQVRRFL
jgi:hypothetical protein